MGCLVHWSPAWRSPLLCFAGEGLVFVRELAPLHMDRVGLVGPRDSRAVRPVLPPPLLWRRKTEGSPQSLWEPKKGMPQPLEGASFL